MSISKNHHFIAQSILSRFKSSNGKLWYFLESNNKGVESRNPKTVFKIKHDNTYKSKNESHDKLELAYSKLDEEWKDFTDKIIYAISLNRIPKFDDTTKSYFFELLHRQIWRSPDIVHKRSNDDLIKKIINNSDYDSESKTGYLQDTDFLKLVEHNAKVLARGRKYDQKILSEYKRYEISFINILDKEHSFLMGSAIRSSSNVGNLYPISSKCAIILRLPRPEGSSLIKVYNSNKSIVETANIDMAKNSSWGIAGNCKQIVEYYSKYVSS